MLRLHFWLVRNDGVIRHVISWRYKCLTRASGIHQFFPVMDQQEDISDEDLLQAAEELEDAVSDEDLLQAVEELEDAG